MKRRRDKESGATAVEFVVLTPILVLLMFASVQVGLALFAQHVAISAAQEGARTAREEAANPNGKWRADSTKVAKDWVTQLLGTLVSNTPTVQPQEPVSINAPHPEAGMNVQFTIVTVVPGWTFSFNETSVGPVECFYTPQGVCNGH